MFYFEDLIIGGSLECLLYAYVTETPVIIDKPLRPFELDEINPSIDLSFLRFRDENKNMAIEVWDRLSFLLSMGGLLLFPNSIETLKYEPKSIFVVTQNMQKVEVRYKNMVKFDSNFTNHVWMYDWFAVRSGGKHDLETLYDEEYLASKLIFHQSKRVGTTFSKDVVALTYLKLKDVYEMEYSEGYVSLKTRRMMSDAGICGTSKGYDPYGTRRFSPIKIEHLHRDIKEHIIPKYSIGQILENEIKTEGKLWNLTKNLFRQQFPFI